MLSIDLCFGIVAPRYSTKEGKKWSEFARDLGDKLFTDKAHPFYGSLEELEGNEFNTRAIDEIVQTLDAISDRVLQLLRVRSHLPQ
jgi:hypothetical protein